MDGHTHPRAETHTHTHTHTHAHARTHVCVLQGLAKEFDHPKVLLDNPDSQFTSMVAETGPENAKILKQVLASSLCPPPDSHPKVRLRDSIRPELVLAGS